jgi:DNA-binding GntR family transcriptional regulator
MSASAATTFQPIARESTRRKVYLTLRDAILSGKLNSGRRLVEIPLAKEFGVSRAVLREALQQLAHEGLVQQNSYKGTHVVRLTPEELDEIVSVRLLLEAEASRLAAARMSNQQRESLAKMAARMASERDATRFAALDLKFHEFIWAASANKTMERALKQVATPLFAMSLLMRTAEERRPARANVRRGDHTPLAEAICSGDQDRAAEAMRFHLTENWPTLRERLARFLASEESSLEKA